MSFYSVFKFFFLNPNVCFAIFIEHYLNLNASSSLYILDLCYTIYFKQSFSLRNYEFKSIFSNSYFKFFFTIRNLKKKNDQNMFFFIKLVFSEFFWFCSFSEKHDCIIFVGFFNGFGRKNCYVNLLVFENFDFVILVKKTWFWRFDGKIWFYIFSEKLQFL